MKTAVFNFSKPSLTGTIASNRIAHFLANTLHVPLLWDKDVADTKWDILFLINGSFQFCKVLPEISQAIEKAGRIVWVQNDYNIIPPKPISNAESAFRKAFVNRTMRKQHPMIFWSTVRANADEYINWNSLTYNPVRPAELTALRKNAKRDLFYYGAFRANRLALFDRYFKDCPVDLTISSSSKEFERYGVSVQPTIIRNHFYEELASHGLGLYIEDKKSSIEFHSPANRFYEMLSAGLPMVFQPEAVQMMEVAGYDIREYVVREPSQLKAMMRNREAIAASQRAAWHTHYPSKLKNAVNAAYRRLTK